MGSPSNSNYLMYENGNVAKGLMGMGMAMAMAMTICFTESSFAFEKLCGKMRMFGFFGCFVSHVQIFFSSGFRGFSSSLKYLFAQ